MSDKALVDIKAKQAAEKIKGNKHVRTLYGVQQNKWF